MPLTSGHRLRRSPLPSLIPRKLARLLMPPPPHPSLRPEPHGHRMPRQQSLRPPQRLKCLIVFPHFIQHRRQRMPRGNRKRQRNAPTRNRKLPQNLHRPRRILTPDHPRLRGHHLRQMRPKPQRILHRSPRLPTPPTSQMQHRLPRPPHRPHLRRSKSPKPPERLQRKIDPIQRLQPLTQRIQNPRLPLPQLLQPPHPIHSLLIQPRLETAVHQT